MSSLGQSPSKAKKKGDLGEEKKAERKRREG